MIRFQVTIDEDTYKALRSLSKQEYRDWRSQASLLIREALTSHGYFIQQPQRDETHKGQGEE